MLFLSRTRWLRRFAENSGLTRRLAARFVSGDTLEQAIAVCGRLNADGFLTTLDRLGENVATVEEARHCWEAGIETISAIEATRLKSTVSIKLSQFGLDISADECLAEVRALAAAASRAGTIIEIDMESSAYTGRTLKIVRDVYQGSGNVRAVIQAYLYRSEKDVDDLCRQGIPVRLCKGAYLEPPEVAYPRKADVDANYRKLMRVLLEKGIHPALATHDASILRDAADLIRTLGLRPEQYEFEMLYGVRRDLQRRLLDDGHPVRVYVPYGTAWYPYFMRRLAERPANVLFLLRQLFRP